MRGNLLGHLDGTCWARVKISLVCGYAETEVSTVNDC